jgi:hypothetical protein
MPFRSCKLFNVTVIRSSRTVGKHLSYFFFEA